MSDLNDLARPVTTDTEPNVLDTLRAHIVRAITWSGYGSTAGKVAGIMSAVTAAVSGGRSMRLYRRNDANSADEEVVSLPGVSIGGSAATAIALATARNINGVAFNGTGDISINLNNQVTFNDSGTGAATGANFNGGVARTVSYNTVGAPSASGANATGTWGINISGSAGSVAWTGVLGRPTDLSAFTNGPGFITSSGSITGNAATATKLATANFTVEESGGKLIFKYGGTTIASMTSAGVFTALSDVAGGGTP
jgi:hypothetical protein